MNTAPRVSVITIFLDAEQFIEEAIESVLAQTYDSWELVLVDDGSSDASTAIARGYAERYPGRVRYLEHAGHQNRGMSASRNLGVRQAAGEYIAFLDADDICFPNALERQVAILDAVPEAGMVYGSTQIWYSWTEQHRDLRRDYIRSIGVKPDTLYRPPDLLPIFLSQKAETPGICSLLVRREAIERVGGFEERFRGMYEDQVMIAKICLSTPVFVAGDCWSRYRQHPRSSCAVAEQEGMYRSSGQPNAAHLAFLTWLATHVVDQGVSHDTIDKALHTALRPYRQPVVDRLMRAARRPTNEILELLLPVARKRLPAPTYHALSAVWRTFGARSLVGAVRFGSLRRLTPISRDFGFDRGLPIDRYYVEGFLAEHAADIRGRVLEIGDNDYTVRFGGDRVTQSDVLHVNAGNPRATIVGDLASADHVPSDAFDCLILTQTLHLIYDVHAAIETIYRILKPGGVVLATVPGISPISRDEWSESWYWSFTALSARKLFAASFPAANVMVGAHGNVLASTAFLYGLATRELRQEELDYRDPQYETLIAIRAVKPGASP